MDAFYSIIIWGVAAGGRGQFQMYSYKQMSKLQYETDSTKDLSDEQPNHHSKRTFFIELTISIAYTLLKIILIAIVAAFAMSLSLVHFKTSNGYLRVQENLWLWQQEIIVDFRVVQAANCPEGWEEFSNYSWPGNVEGCSCTFNVGLFEYNAVLQGRCGQREFAKGCESVAANPAIQFQFWKAGAHLCVKRLKNYNFYSSQANVINPPGYNISNCSSGNYYQIDLIEPIPCPVTSIANDFSLNSTIEELNFTFNRQDNYPAVYFRISEYNFCETLADNGKSPGRTANYILETNQQYECSSVDARTVLLDSQGEADFFHSNPKIEYVTSTLPAYPQLTNDYNYSIGYLRYPSWTYACRNSNTYNLNMATAFFTLDQISVTVSVFQILILVSTLSSVVFVLYYWVSCYFYLKTKYMHGYLYLKDYQIRRINPHTNIVKNRNNEVGKFLAFQISPAASILFLVVLYFQLSSSKAWFSGAYSCTDGSFIGYIKSYEQFMGGQMVLALSSIFVSLGMICLDICYLLWRYFKGDLEEAEDDDEVISISKTTNEQISIINDCEIKDIKVTEDMLVDNTFYMGKDLNVYTFEDDEGGISQYSQSQKSD